LNWSRAKLATTKKTLKTYIHLLGFLVFFIINKKYVTYRKMFGVFQSSYTPTPRIQNTTIMCSLFDKKIGNLMKQNSKTYTQKKIWHWQHKYHCVLVPLSLPIGPLVMRLFLLGFQRFTINFNQTTCSYWKWIRRVLRWKIKDFFVHRALWCWPITTREGMFTCKRLFDTHVSKNIKYLSV